MRDDDEFCGCDDCQEEGPGAGIFGPAQLNWADLAWCVTIVPYYVAKGVTTALGTLQTALAQQSMLIDQRQRFAREAGAAIERLASGVDK